MTWALVTTGTNRERIVAEKLTQKGLTVRFFRMRRPVLHKGRVREKLVPAFSRYLFTSVFSPGSPDPQWRTMIESGAYPVRGAGRFPAEVSDGAVSDLALRGRDDIFSEIENRGRFKEGDRLSVVGGLFMGHDCVYDRATAPGHSLVFINSLRVPVKDSDLTIRVVKKKRRHRRSKRRPLTAQAA